MQIIRDIFHVKGEQVCKQLENFSWKKRTGMQTTGEFLMEKENRYVDNWRYFSWEKRRGMQITGDIFHGKRE